MFPHSDQQFKCFYKMNKLKTPNSMGHRLTQFAITRPRVVAWAMGLMLLILASLALLPSVWPQSFSFLHAVQIDTDPENMLAQDAPVRLFHHQAKQEFSLHDIIVVGIVNEQHPDGVFNPDSLKRIFQLTEFARQLHWPDQANPGSQSGVIDVDLIAPSRVDNIEQGGPGEVRFSWLMPAPPTTRAEALLIRDRALRIPFLKDTLVSADGRAMALYLPITSKDVSYRVREALLTEVADWQGSGDEVYITGLPVAEDTFGVEMFVQMAISAPLAMLVIFLLLWWFFDKFVLVISPMIVAVVSALATMALLIVTGNTIHIMSSMIPIFVMPIAVLDAVHILSEFFDRYPQIKDRRKTIEQVMDHLFMPMLYTTLTTIAGFASLALTPIPPVQTFGLFIAFGVFLAWLLTITFIPAFIMFIPEQRLQGFGHAVEDAGNGSLLARALQALGQHTYLSAARIVSLTIMLIGLSGWGMSLITINDNPIKWFGSEHPIRVADKVLNEHFGGTYMAYLQLQPAAQDDSLQDWLDGFKQRLETRQNSAVKDGFSQAQPIYAELASQAAAILNSQADKAALLSALSNFASERQALAADSDYDSWDDVLLFLDQQKQLDEVFKQPDALAYLEALQAHLTDNAVVGKGNSLVDVVKTVHRELFSGADSAFRIPDSSQAVAQTLLTYQNSHRPQDLWHFVTPDFRKTVLWLQLTSGDNRDMQAVVDSVHDFMQANPAPYGLEAQWFGLTYINTVWQDEMVAGMLEAFMGSFVVVLLMMSFLFRSVLWGLLSMIPLTVTVGLIYGIIGFSGKDYDMPVAVLSSLSLGLAIDYAIHFIARAREIRGSEQNWQACIEPMFGEPARAIARNAIILGAGFLPLLAAPLVPYKTVGVFIAAIIISAGLITLIILPALIRLLESRLFTTHDRTTVL